MTIACCNNPPVSLDGVGHVSWQVDTSAIHDPFGVLGESGTLHTTFRVVNERQQAGALSAQLDIFRHLGAGLEGFEASSFHQGGEQVHSLSQGRGVNSW